MSAAADRTREIQDVLAVMTATTATHARSWAEYLGGTRIRFHHPCGHASTKDYSKGPRAKRMGEEGCRLMVRWWAKDKGGVTAPCPTCERRAKR